MLHFGCDSTVASLEARRDNVLASKCEYPPFRYSLHHLHTLRFLESRFAVRNDSNRHRFTAISNRTMGKNV